MVKDNFFNARLIDTYMLTKQARHFVLQLEEHFTYIPGQFITIHFEFEGKLLKRSYSIANHPSQDNIIEFAAGEVVGGPGTEFLFNLAQGNIVQISGPYGRLIIKDMPVERYIFVGTSTGITPYRAMLPMLTKLLEEHPLLKIVLIQGIQRREDILYLEDFKPWALEHSPRVDLRLHFSREEPQEFYEYKGYVQTAFTALNINPEKDLIYLCGNPGMIDDSFRELQELGVTSQRIIREKYISR